MPAVGAAAATVTARVSATRTGGGSFFTKGNSVQRDNRRYGDGDCYEREYRLGRMHGQGKMSYADGAAYALYAIISGGSPIRKIHGAGGAGEAVYIST